ncbi:MAG: DUF378 domain-containing protein [Candidatus Paceibacterota bacterium]|jgi:hypothetical protein
MKVLNWVAIILVIVGAVNWGLVGAAGLDLVALIFGAGSSLAMLVYVLVGLAGLYTIYLAKKLA